MIIAWDTFLMPVADTDAFLVATGNKGLDLGLLWIGIGFEIGKGIRNGDSRQ